jgi:hypothetical protein
MVNRLGAQQKKMSGEASLCILQFFLFFADVLNASAVHPK